VSDESSNDKKGKGFAGLDSMVSDVSKDDGNALKTEPTKASKPASKPTPTPPHTPPAASSGEPKSTGFGNTGAGKVGWIVAGAIVLFVHGNAHSQFGKEKHVIEPMNVQARIASA